MKNYVTLDDDEDDADFRYKYRDNITTHFEQDLYDKSFSHQDQNKADDILQNT